MVFVLNSHKSLNTFVDDSDTYSALKRGASKRSGSSTAEECYEEIPCRDN